MITSIDHHIIKAGMRRSRRLRAEAFIRTAKRITSGLRHTARTLVGSFT